MTSASINTNTSTSIDSTTSTSTNGTTSTSIHGTTSESIAHTIPASIDGDSCFRSTPLEIPERSSCPQDIADSTHKSVDISSCDPTSDGDREITIEDFLELSSILGMFSWSWRMEKSLKTWIRVGKSLWKTSWSWRNGLKIWIRIRRRSLMMISMLRGEIMKLHQRLASIDTSLMRSIDNHPTSSINVHPISSIDNQQLTSIYTHTPSSIDTHPIASIDTHEEAAGLHKRVKRIHDPVKIVVPCAVVEVEFPIPPDRSMQLSPNTGVFDDHILAVASQRGLRCRGEVDKSPGEAASIVTDQISTLTLHHRSTLPLHHRSILPLHRRSTLDAYQSIKSSLCVEILGMEIPPRDQTSLGERRGGIGRREKGSRVILSYHLFLASQMVSENPECAAVASHSHLQSFELSLLLK
ncbi:hypothetical protein F2Q70_00011513 [Brassica cretica]|uniref:Uncharacterized protein n=1 Tax=Brassica cretica TaxID=69181 RepID=A0A8S9RR51_BRACR|nr:hypothetical protein F2Q70_00011513 [Brassica cretica]KAF3575299.1 hypothetical protein F2Q69_00059499 [Brassica cretica]